MVRVTVVLFFSFKSRVRGELRLALSYVDESNGAPSEDGDTDTDNVSDL